MDDQAPLSPDFEAAQQTREYEKSRLPERAKAQLRSLERETQHKKAVEATRLAEDRTGRFAREYARKLQERPEPSLRPDSVQKTGFADLPWRQRHDIVDRALAYEELQAAADIDARHDRSVDQLIARYEPAEVSARERSRATPDIVSAPAPEYVQPTFNRSAGFDLGSGGGGGRDR